MRVLISDRRVAVRVDQSQVDPCPPLQRVPLTRGRTRKEFQRTPSIPSDRRLSATGTAVAVHFLDSNNYPLYLRPMILNPRTSARDSSSSRTSRTNCRSRLEGGHSPILVSINSDVSRFRSRRYRSWYHSIMILVERSGNEITGNSRFR